MANGACEFLPVFDEAAPVRRSRRASQHHERRGAEPSRQTPRRLIMSMTQRRLIDLLYQALETAQSGIQVYETALKCARNSGLQAEWLKCLDRTRRQEELVRGVLDAMGLDPSADTPGRTIVRHIGGSLVRAMWMALETRDAKGAELVAGECVALTETKNHLNWNVLGACAKHAGGQTKRILDDACDEGDDSKGERRHDSVGWARELWLAAVGVGAVLPPPNEQRGVKAELGATRAHRLRGAMHRV